MVSIGSAGCTMYIPSKTFRNSFFRNLRLPVFAESVKITKFNHVINSFTKKSERKKGTRNNREKSKDGHRSTNNDPQQSMDK